VSQQSGRIPPYVVVYSERCLEATRQLLKNARANQRLAEIAQAIRDIHTRLQWIPLKAVAKLRWGAKGGTGGTLGAERRA
jgi:hypothetical protein